MLEQLWLAPTDLQCSLRLTDSAHRPRDLAVSEAWLELYDTERGIQTQTIGMGCGYSTPVHTTPLRFSPLCSNLSVLHQENTCLELQTKLAESREGSSAMESALEEAKP